MRFFRRAWLRAVALVLTLSLAFWPLPATAANVTGGTQVVLGFSQTPAAGFLSGKPLALTDTLTTLFKVTGTAADQVDGISVQSLTFAPSTPQNIDLTALQDVLKNNITCARVRFMAIKVYWQTDNVPLLVGGAGSNEWNGPLSSGGKLSVYPSSAANSGWFILTAPQTTGIPVTGGSKILKLDPQTASGQVNLVIATCST
jgi:hypothetical protein